MNINRRADLLPPDQDTAGKARGTPHSGPGFHPCHHLYMCAIIWPIGTNDDDDDDDDANQMLLFSSRRPL